MISWAWFLLVLGTGMEGRLMMKEFFIDDKILGKKDKPMYYQTDEEPNMWFTPKLVWEIRGVDFTKRNPFCSSDVVVFFRNIGSFTESLLVAQVDLVGGYYDAGDHVKFGLPMAFTVTMLSWCVIEHDEYIADAGELQHACDGGDKMGDWLLY
ncbi:putative cellulase [Helianthus annuus]|uniref:cellulase n=1 Tax=Helianthus annuus TaxID=4232 RepID=A0A9K3E118_HELAN|nr:putative cellulase [Helianthus annuus]KAJ0456315.1 putative cellulase [Helianthus annuus]KAJ0473563.1 putative cellulase [Helianthus annuus]KAJ0652941.1 putative cellulase [Helianthus annuus]